MAETCYCGSKTALKRDGTHFSSCFKCYKSNDSVKENAKSYLVYDTETTGLPERISFNVYHPPSQIGRYANSRIVQIAWRLYDAQGIAISPAEEYLVTQNGWTITHDTEKIHGISNDMCAALGKPFELVGGKFETCLRKADVVVGHNVDFDVNVLASEYFRNGDSATANALLSKPRQCTLALARKLKYKKCKLVDLYSHLFGEPLVGAHSAIYDMEASARVWFKLSKNIDLGMYAEIDLGMYAKIDLGMYAEIDIASEKCPILMVCPIKNTLKVFENIANELNRVWSREPNRRQLEAILEVDGIFACILAIENDYLKNLVHVIHGISLGE